MDKAGAYAIQGRAAHVRRGDPRQLLGHHGPAAVRDRRCCCGASAIRSRNPLRSLRTRGRRGDARPRLDDTFPLR
ncbi:MAG: Maf family protein [Comamonadaceae bacterium]|nr:Maf family protein [Comamonadaceae bacterium]